MAVEHFIRGKSWERALQLLQELVSVIEAEYFEFNHVTQLLVNFNEYVIANSYSEKKHNCTNTFWKQTGCLGPIIAWCSWVEDFQMLSM